MNFYRISRFDRLRAIALARQRGYTEHMADAAYESITSLVKPNEVEVAREADTLSAAIALAAEWAPLDYWGAPTVQKIQRVNTPRGKPKMIMREQYRWREDINGLELEFKT